MTRLHCTVLVVGLGLVVLVLGGCGSNSGGSGGMVDTSGKIGEYVGDGHGGTKPLPDFAKLLPGGDQVQTQALPTLLSNGATHKYTNVPSQQANWFCLPVLTSAATWLVTVQQLNNEDVDLFLLDGNSFYTSNATTLGYSDRTPSGGTTDVVDGNVPDWVAYTFAGATGGNPGAQIAVRGMPGAPDPKHFNIEADIVPQLFVNGSGKAGTLALRDSNWFYFNALNGIQYTVRLTAISGDPDIYVYSATSTAFIDKSVVSGGGNVTFTASGAGRRYIRVHAFTAGKYSVKVTSP